MLTVGTTICDSHTCTRPGCSVLEGCQGHAWRERGPGHYLEVARQLVADAAADGVVITIEQVALKPLAMGNHESVVSVRAKRGAS